MRTTTGSPTTKKRVPLWDNARWIAMVLVVVGHGILPLIGESNTAYSVYLFIYSFHVAVFVTVSGYFAKSGPPTSRSLRQVLTDPERRAEMVRLGLEQATHFSLDRMARETLAVYHKTGQRR